MMATIKEKKAATVWNSFSPCIKLFPHQSYYILIKNANFVWRARTAAHRSHMLHSGRGMCVCGWSSSCYLNAHVQYKCGRQWVCVLYCNRYIYFQLIFLCVCTLLRGDKEAFSSFETLLVLVALYVRLRDKCHLVLQLLLHTISSLTDGINSWIT